MTKTVMVCDDEQFILEAVSFVVKDEGYQVVSVESGDECLYRARQNKPDLLLLDVMMPGIDGFEVCRAVREDPDLNHTRVVLLTALGQESDILKGKACGAEEYLTKPFCPRELRTKLHAWLD